MTKECFLYLLLKKKSANLILNICEKNYEAENCKETLLGMKLCLFCDMNLFRGWLSPCPCHDFSPVVLQPCYLKLDRYD